MYEKKKADIAAMQASALRWTGAYAAYSTIKLQPTTDFSPAHRQHLYDDLVRPRQLQYGAFGSSSDAGSSRRLRRFGIQPKSESEVRYSLWATLLHPALRRLAFGRTRRLHDHVHLHLDAISFVQVLSSPSRRTQPEQPISIALLMYISSSVRSAVAHGS